MTTLSKGSRGPEVKALQQKLSLVADGIFGPLTEEAVRDFQHRSGLKADGIAGPLTLAALGLQAPAARAIDKIIIHCSATPQGEAYSVEQIRQMHLARGFADIGYHYYIALDGTIHTGRDEAKIGAHCTGYNSRSIGICYCGGSPPRSEKDWAKKGCDTRTPEQKAALLRLLRELRARYPMATIHGHNEFAAKACPSFIVARDKDICAI